MEKKGENFRPTIKRQSDSKPGAAGAGRPGANINFNETEAETVKRINGLLKKLQAATYPEIFWRFDPAGVHISNVDERSIIHAMNVRGFPDLQVFYKGRTLFLEIKRPSIHPDTLSAPTENHIREQLDWINRLRKAGFAAGFAIGYDMAFRKIYDFLDNRPVKLI